MEAICEGIVKTTWKYEVSSSSDGRFSIHWARDERLTLITAAVSTRVVPDPPVAALVTLFHMTTENGSPAHLDRIHDARLSSGQHVMVGFPVGFAVAVQDVRYFQFLMFHRFAA